MRHASLLVPAVFLLTFAPVAFATNGYFMHGVGTSSKAMAGATTAFPQEALDTETNPAAAVFVDGGYSVALAAFSPDRQYTVTGNPSGFPQTFGLTPGTVTSKSNYFAMPSAGWNIRPNDVSAWTVNFTGHGGMNTDYRTSTFYGSSHTGVDLAQMFLTTTYGRKITPNHALGISLLLAGQRFKASGLEAFAPFSSEPASLTGNGYDWSYGAGLKVGYLGRLRPDLQIGVAFSPEVQMSELDSYAGLFAEEGGFDIPASVSAGVAYEPVNALTLTLDYQRIHYSDVPSVGNPMLPNLVVQPLGSGSGAGFGWEDINVYKVGVRWDTSDVWTWRAGYSKTKQPIPSSEVLFNILAPGVVEDHFTAGFSRKLDRGRFNVAVMYAPSQSVRGTNPLEAPGAQQIELTMNEWEVEFGYSFGF